MANLIAAGEVVERPASVVKELIENSIDAGAGIITVEINAGGMTYIRVTDNGCGITPEDARVAFLRHATSKLHDAEGLEAIGTLGFRGEALAAIAAVSRIELLTRESGAQEGLSLSLEAGEVTDMSPAGCPEGTTIIVRDLFFNTPARLKFMRSDRAEGSGIASAVMRCALSHPEVSVRLIKDGKTEYHTPGDSRVDSCIYSLFGREFHAGLLKAESDDAAVSATGYISRPEAARGNRSYQFFFVNGRIIRSVTLQAALEQAYAKRLPTGRYPSCVLHITIKPGDVDVNVHPAKTEVKFVSDKLVFDSIYYAALGALNNAQPAPLSAPDSSADDSLVRKQHGGFITMSEDDDERRPRAGGARATGGFGGAAAGLQEQQSGLSSTHHTPNSTLQTPHSSPNSTPLSSPNPTHHAPNSTHSIISSPSIPYQTQLLFTPEGEPDSAAVLPFRLIGEAMNTYIVVEYYDSLWLIDKHAAHERIHFDALRSEGFSPMSQALISPIVCRHGYEDVSLLLDNTELLDELGFVVESFGDDAVAVRSIPADIDIVDAEPVLSDICTELRLGGPAEPASRDNIFRSIACKAAIKAGTSSGRRELMALSERVLSGEISHCPHGRPVAYEMTKAALDRSFKRS